ncbi:MAG: FkbM family methyltransferase [Desulfomonilaceae bacterium]
MDWGEIELRCLRFFTTRLPRARGADYVLRQAWRFYTRKKRQPAPTSFFGFKVIVNPMDRGEEQLLLGCQLYNYHEMSFMKRFLREGDVFLDLGAHIGTFTLVASGAVGKTGRVVSLEPHPQSYQRLCHHLELNSIQNVIALNVAASDKEEICTMGLTQDGQTGTNSLLFDYLKPQGSSGMNVECHPLADILRRCNVSAIRGAKIDIEGYEYRVLKAYFSETRKEFHPEFIIVEYISFVKELAGGNTIDLLLDEGYKIQWHDKAKRNYVMVLEPQ